MKASAVRLCLFLLSATLLTALLGPAADAAPAEGALVIAGGGRLGDAITNRFRQLAGGDDARLVVIPTASERQPTIESIQQRWTRRGFDRVVVLHTRDRSVAEAEGFADPIREANAVWISGGQQSRLAKVYANGPVERELKALVQRGGVVGGTSAGAAIQSHVMIASGKSKPKMSEGFDLAPGVIIDQHFLVRNRFNRLLHAVQKHPDKLGVAIDEGTAIELRGTTATVLGDSFVVVVRPAKPQRPLSISSYSKGKRFEIGE